MLSVFKGSCQAVLPSSDEIPVEYAGCSSIGVVWSVPSDMNQDNFRFHNKVCQGQGGKISV